VVGCEVLMRINDGHQVIFPDEIIPAVMTRGLMQKLDREVSKKAMHELLEKIPNDKPFRLAFNFFPESVNAKQLDAHFKKCLGMRDYPAVTLDLEITEYSMSDSLVDEVKHLRKLHYHISIDDFGTGYSNLKLLSEVKPDVVKIDKSFVFDMEDASLRSSLIPEMVTLARGIGAKVVAEGIENEQQARLLRELSVDYGQGYYFAKPMPLEEFLIHLASHS
jgi:EAL domain-containing protein (putative c-di-GMP-specific phosphodiesterase class I)